MTEAERDALKEELRTEILAEIKCEEEREKARQRVNNSLKPVLEKYLGDDRGGLGSPFHVLVRYRRYDTWEHIRRITCNILGVSYVREIKDGERARRIADRLCALVAELASETVERS